MRACRSAIERQTPGAIVHGLSEADADRLRVALHSAETGLEDMAGHVGAPDWTRSLPEELGESIISSLRALAVAVSDDADEESRASAARSAQVLRGHIHETLTQTTTTGAAPFEPTALLAGLTLLSDGEVVA